MTSVPISMYTDGAYPLHGVFKALVAAGDYNGGPVGFYSPHSESDQHFDVQLTLPDPAGKQPLVVTGHKSGMDLMGISLTFGDADSRDVVHVNEPDRAARMVAIIRERAAALKIEMPV